MHGLTRRWVLPTPAQQSRSGEASFPGLDLPPLVQRILLARGVEDARTAQTFCSPRLTDLHDPSLVPNLDAAVERLVDAVRGGETIAIYGDYDVDGMTATAILYHVIRAAAPDAELLTYVPHRIDEGYGLNAEALRQLRARGAGVVISVDCGVTAVQPARVAREIGLDLIITDHHRLPPEEVGLPDAVVVHPRLPGSAYPFGELCGAGVAFKVAWRFATCWCGSERVSANLQRVLLDMLPLAALGTIADVVPLVDENRIIAAHGLRRIKQSPLPGLRALIEASDLAGEDIDAEKVGFRLGPRLNACGRMGHAADAVRLLTDATPEEARRIADDLTGMNKKRQSTERRIFRQAAERAEQLGLDDPACRAIVLADEAWHPGVIGIVCSRMAERFGRPTILLQRQGDRLTGSGRSVDGFDLHAALVDCSAHLERYGGHAAAAGLTLPAETLDAFTAAFTAIANERIGEDALTPLLRIDCDAALSELDVPTVQRVAQLSPFGRDNEPPTLRVSGVVVEEPPRPVGGQGRHLSMRLRSGDGPRRSIRAIWWHAGELADRLAAGMRLDVAIEPKLNAWQGRVSVEAELRDVVVAPAPAPPAPAP